MAPGHAWPGLVSQNVGAAPFRPSSTAPLLLVGLCPALVVLAVMLPFARNVAFAALTLGLATAAGVVVAFVVRARASDAVGRLVGGAAPDLTQAGPARLANLVESVAAATGVPAPVLILVEDPAANALVFGRKKRTRYAIVDVPGRGTKESVS